MMIRSIFAIFFALILPLSSLFAQNSNKILATVHQTPISSYDLDQYLKIINSQNKININSPQIKQQALNKLIESQILNHLSPKLGINIGSQDIERYIQRLAKMNNTSLDKIVKSLKKNGINEDSFRKKIKNELIWDAMKKNFMASISVSEGSVKNEIKRLETLQKNPQLLLFEIFLPIKNAKDQEKVRKQMLSIRQKVIEKKDFGTFAKKFSQASSAKNNGYMGWVTLKNLNEDLQVYLENMPAGSLSEPILTDNGYYIILVQGKRNGNVLDSQLLRHIASISIKTNKSDSKNTIKAKKETIAKLLKSSKSCPTLMLAIKKNKNIHGGILKNITPQIMMPKLFKNIQYLNINQSAGPFKLNNEILGLMVCGFDHSDQLPSAQAVEQSLMQNKLQNYVTKIMNQWKSQSIIKIYHSFI